MSLERLTLIEQPYALLPSSVQARVSQAAHLPLGASVVVGMQLREQPDILLDGYLQAHTERRRELQIQSANARRLSRYFLEHLALPSRSPVDAEAFMRFTLGADAASMHMPDRWERLEYTADSYTEFTLDKGYVFLDCADGMPHLAYGIDKSHLCLTSFGLSNPPVVAHIKDIAELHQTSRIAQIVLRSPTQPGAPKHK